MGVLEEAAVFRGSLQQLFSYLGDVLHGSTYRLPFCWVINDEVLPEVAEQLPGEDRWGFASGATSPSCLSTARSCLDTAVMPVGWGEGLQSRAGGSGDKLTQSQWQDPVQRSLTPPAP